MNFYNFIQYDYCEMKPIYCLFNFDYSKYALDYHIQSTSKYVIFTDFWNRVGFDYSKPYVVPPEYTQYFFPITIVMVQYLQTNGFFHNGYLWRVVPQSYLSYDVLAEQQFEMVQYNESEVRRLQDYFYEDVERVYSKYNFDFTLYQGDFLFFGNHLLTFTDFVIRNLALSGVVNDSQTYGLYDGFKKYFKIQDKDSLLTYMNSYGVDSVLNNVYKSENNIDYQQYIIINNIPIEPQFAKEQYIRTGQFDQNIIPFIQQTNPAINIAKQGCCSVATDKAYGSGFLYTNGDGKVYLVSAYHLIQDNEDQFYIYASLQKLNANSSIPVSTTAQFRIIGIDRRSDIMVSLYEPDLPFNISNKIDITPYQPLTINTDYSLQNGDEIFVVGNVGNDDITSIYSGVVMNSSYTGPVDESERPPSILLQCYLTPYSSGSPVFYNDTSGSPLEVIGFVVDKLRASPQASISIQANVLSYIVNQMIENYYYYLLRFGKDEVGLNNAIKFGVAVAFLGINDDYYYRLYPTIGNLEIYKRYPELKNLNYTGGLLIKEFKLAFDFIENEIITTAKDLNKHNIFKIEGILLNTTLYQHYLQNFSPILITDISYYDSIQDNYQKIYIGKFSNQKPLATFLYGFQPIASFPNDIIYYNPIRYEYAPITIGYYWFNGSVWNYAEEEIGGNTPEWYAQYTDLNGNLFYQHKFEFPYTLYDFIKFFMPHLGDMGKETMNLGLTQQSSSNNSSVF